MIRPEPEEWNQTLADMWRLSVEADMSGRENAFWPPYMIVGGQTSTTQWAIETGHDSFKMRRQCWASPWRHCLGTALVST